MSDEKKPRQRSTKGTGPSKTKQKGAPVVGRQAETLFGGPRGNTPGLSRDQALARYENGKLAERAQGIWLKTLVDKLEDVPESALDELRTDTLRLVQDAIDRANGKAVSSVDVTSSDGSASLPSAIRLIGPEDDDGE